MELTVLIPADGQRVDLGDMQQQFILLFPAHPDSGQGIPVDQVIPGHFKENKRTLLFDAGQGIRVFQDMRRAIPFHQPHHFRLFAHIVQVQSRRSGSRDGERSSRDEKGGIQLILQRLFGDGQPLATGLTGTGRLNKRTQIQVVVVKVDPHDTGHHRRKIPREVFGFPQVDIQQHLITQVHRLQGNQRDQHHPKDDLQNPSERHILMPGTVPVQVSRDQATGHRRQRHQHEREHKQDDMCRIVDADKKRLLGRIKDHDQGRNQSMCKQVFPLEIPRPDFRMKERIPIGHVIKLI